MRRNNSNLLAAASCALVLIPGAALRAQNIGKNLSNTITTGTCNSYNDINGLFGGQFQGNDAVGHGPAGADALSCFIDRGREFWLRLIYKPF